MGGGVTFPMGGQTVDPHMAVRKSDLPHGCNSPTQYLRSTDQCSEKVVAKYVCMHRTVLSSDFDVSIASALTSGLKGAFWTSVTSRSVLCLLIPHAT